MKSFKPRNAALVALLAAALVVVGVLVNPRLVLAQHPILDVRLFVDWFGETVPFDIEAHVQLLDEGGVPLFGWEANKDYDSQYQFWTHTFFNVPDGAVRYRFTWDTGDPLLYDWAPPPALEGEIDWQAAEANDQTAAIDP